ncbi:MAG: hypothetical protein LBU95_05495, partial [Rikenellaceae bacterium]|nr:hypothetical protein [Rikenellaceae bacterium]
IAVDWEHAWYNGMRLGSTDDYYMSDDSRTRYKNDIKASFKGADNLRIGAEFRPIPEVALRAGYAWYGSGVKDNDYEKKKFVTPTAGTPYSTVDKPVAIGSSSYSVGVGYRIGLFSLDAAYVFSDVKYSDYALYWYDGPDNNDDVLVTGSGPVKSSMKRNIVTLTAGFRF